MNETETEEATRALSVLIVQLIRSKGRKMHNGRNKPAIRLVLEARRPRDDLPGLYERLGSLMRRRGDLEAEIQTLMPKKGRSNVGAEALQRFEGELDRVKVDIAGIDKEIKRIERRRIRKPEEAAE